MKINRNNRLQKSKLIPVKYILLLLLSFLIGSAQAQKELLDTLKITPGIKIIGMYPNSDQQKTYRPYNFIIEDPAKIQEFVKHVKLGAETPNSFEFNGFGLLVIKDFMRIGSWTINPKLKNAMVHDGHSYAFDFEQISSLNKQFPFDYEVQKKTFGKKAEFETFLARQKNNANSTWCKPCIAAMPHFNAMASKFKNRGVVFIAQDVMEDDRQKVLDFLKANDKMMGFDVAYGGGKGSDFEREWIKPAGVNAIPQTFVIKGNKLLWQTSPDMINEAVIEMLIKGDFSIEKAKKSITN